MDVTYISLSYITDYINSWRLAATFDNFESIEQVLKYLNLIEYKAFDKNTLDKTKYSTAYVNTYLCENLNKGGLDGSKIDGFITKTINAHVYFKLMLLAIDNVGNLFSTVKEVTFKINEKLNSYIKFVRSQRESWESYNDDKGLLWHDAAMSIDKFAKVRNFLSEKGSKILESSNVIISVEFVKHYSDKEDTFNDY